MTTFTADAVGTFVALAVSDVSQPSVLTVTRDPSPGSITVRGTPVEMGFDDATVLTDVEFPYGADITYTAVLTDPVDGSEIETLTDTVTAIPLGRDGMVISNPFTNRQVVLTAVDQRDESSAFRGSRMDLAGTPYPMYVTEVHGGWTWVNEWHTATQSERETLDALLRFGQPVLLRVSAGCDLRDGWVTPEQIDVTRVGIKASGSGRRWNVRVAEIKPPDSSVETVAVTLQDVHEYEPTTLQALSNRDPSTLLELSLAVIAGA